jgi:hypothetical protein
MKRLATKVLMTCGILLTVGAGTAATAYADSSSAYTETLPTVSSSSGTITSTPAVASSDGAAPVLASTSSTSLAFTGADVTGTVAVGAVLVGGGVVLVRAGRRRRNA